MVLIKGKSDCDLVSNLVHSFSMASLFDNSKNAYSCFDSKTDGLPIVTWKN